MSQGIIKATDNGRHDISSEDKSHYKVVKVNDIAYNSMRMWQGASGCSPYEGIVSPAYTVVTPKENIDTEFFAYFFKTASMIKLFRLNSQGLTSDTWNLKYPAFSGIDIICPPSYAEQRQIAAYFRSLDGILSGCEARLSSLRRLKEGALQAFFPQQGETQPKIRFKGCKGEWVRKKLGDIAFRITRKNVNMESTLPLTISAANGLVSQDSFFNNIVAGSNLQNYYLIKKGEFAYNKSRSSEYPVGAVKRLDKFEKGVLSTLYIIFKLNDGVSSDYVAYFFDTNLWYGEISKRASEGARNHGLLNIGAEDFLDIEILLPPTLSEQRQIANFFRTLDLRIELERQRIEKLKQLKAACLEKMFV